MMKTKSAKAINPAISAIIIKNLGVVTLDINLVLKLLMDEIVLDEVG